MEAHAARADREPWQQLKHFLTYAIGPGQKFGAKLEFSKLPPTVLQADRKTNAKLGAS
jgi:hypothetical protein